MKLNIHLYYDPEIPLLVIYPTDTKMQCQENTCRKKLIAILLTIIPNWEQPYFHLYEDG